MQGVRRELSGQDDKVMMQIPYGSTQRELSLTREPTLVADWVLWEFAAVVKTDGITLDTKGLYNLLTAELAKEKAPIDIILSTAGWYVEGNSSSSKKIKGDRRSRIVATLQNSIFGETMQFIAGIDYFGQSNWADIQMMLIVQPEPPPPIPPSPQRPMAPNSKPLIPNELLAVAGLIALSLLFTGNGGLQVLGVMGAIGIIVIGIMANQNIVKAQAKYEMQLREYEEANRQRNEIIENIKKEEIELRENRGIRSFQWDELRMLHAIMTNYIREIVRTRMLAGGATVEKFVHGSKNQEIIAANTETNLLSQFQ